VPPLVELVARPSARCPGPLGIRTSAESPRTFGAKAPRLSGALGSFSGSSIGRPFGRGSRENCFPGYPENSGMGLQANPRQTGLGVPRERISPDDSEVKTLVSKGRQPRPPPRTGGHDAEPLLIAGIEVGPPGGTHHRLDRCSAWMGGPLCRRGAAFGQTRQASGSRRPRQAPTPSPADRSCSPKKSTVSTVIRLARYEPASHKKRRSSSAPELALVTLRAQPDELVVDVEVQPPPVPVGGKPHVAASVQVGVRATFGCTPTSLCRLLCAGLPERLLGLGPVAIDSAGGRLG
jgi:hypothetical protein